MQRIVFLLTLIAFVACKKEPDPEKQARVTYKVVETTSAKPSYTVTYSAESNSTRTYGPITADTWESEIIRDKERGDYVSLTLESNSGSGSFKMYVYMNGVLWQETQGDLPYSPISISGNLPE